jgi:hypothetical protein
MYKGGKVGQEERLERKEENKEIKRRKRNRRMERENKKKEGMSIIILVSCVTPKLKGRSKGHGITDYIRMKNSRYPSL